MFYDIVSSLSFTPQAVSQLTFYLRRLRGENLTRKLSVVFGVLVFGLQLLSFTAPATSTNASSDNDIVFGGLGSADPRGAVLQVYDSDHDSLGHNGYPQLFSYFHISRADLANSSVTTISSSDHALLSLGRDHKFAQDQTIDLSAVSPPASAANPYGCPSPHPQISQGAKGDCVRYLQWSLNHKNSAGLAEDGDFGPLTNSAVRNFQSSHGLAVDGIVGPKTWGALDSIPAGSAPGAHVYYLRPLYLWDTNGPSSYQALTGRADDGSTFYVMLACGNIVIKNTPTYATPYNTPYSTPYPTPAVKTYTTPYATPYATPYPTPLVGTPSISKSKTAVYLNKTTGGSKPVDANGSTAAPADLVSYTLTTRNTGTAAQTGFVVTEDVHDITEYADLTNLHGGNLTGGIITWPAVNIPAGGQVIETFDVKIKSPVPTTAQSLSDPTSFDLHLDNVYGNLVRVNVTTPPKQIEQTAAPLPDTGAGNSLIVVSVILALLVFFYTRNRQLIREVQILRLDHNPGGPQ